MNLTRYKKILNLTNKDQNIANLYEFIFSRKLFISFAIIVSFIAIIYCIPDGLNLAFNDAKSHMNISRRMIDSTNPGFAQLGSSWLPLLHILMLGTVWNDFLWHSGLTGLIVSAPAFILASFFIYSVIYTITKNKFAAFFGGLIYVLNPNSLYAQTTALTEILYTTVLSGSVYFILQWYKKNRLVDFILGSFFVFLTAITRYEGWALAVISPIVVFIASYFKDKKYAKAENLTILFMTVAVSGILIWLLWQWSIFGSPIYFLHNEFSAAGQTKVAVERGYVPSYHRIDLAFMSFWYAAANTAGFIIMILWTVSIIPLFYFSYRKEKLIEFIILLLTITPFMFEFYTLYSGKAPINVPQIPPYTSFNIRFGLYLFPSIAIFLGYLMFMGKKFIKGALISLLIIQIFIFINSGPIAMLLEEGAVVTSDQKETYAYLRKNYDGGLILASAATTDPVMFDSHIDLKNYINEGSGEIWERSLKDPIANNIKYIMFSKNELSEVRDGVFKNLVLTKKINMNYKPVIDNNGYAIYKIKK